MNSETNRDEMQNEDKITHGVDGWGLEVYSRDEEVRDGKVFVWGEYTYERTVKGKTETREVARLLEVRSEA